MAGDRGARTALARLSDGTHQKRIPGIPHQYVPDARLRNLIHSTFGDPPARQPTNQEHIPGIPHHGSGTQLPPKTAQRVFKTIIYLHSGRAAPEHCLFHTQRRKTVSISTETNQRHIPRIPPITSRTSVPGTLSFYTYKFTIHVAYRLATRS